MKYIKESLMRKYKIKEIWDVDFVIKHKIEYFIPQRRYFKEIIEKN